MLSYGQAQSCDWHSRHECVCCLRGNCVDVLLFDSGTPESGSLVHGRQRNPMRRVHPPLVHRPLFGQIAYESESVDQHRGR